MFTVHCPSHGGRVLLGPRSITGFTNTDNGIVVDWRCSCGATGTQRYGAHRHAAPSITNPDSTFESAA